MKRIWKILKFVIYIIKGIITYFNPKKGGDKDGKS